MSSKTDIQTFVSQRKLALAGVSRDGTGFGNAVRRSLQDKGYTVHLVHPEAQQIEGMPCVGHLGELTEQVEGLVLVTPPAATLELLREAAAAGIRRVWLQQGAESVEAVHYCREAGLQAVHGECLLMFLEPPGFIHGCHRAIRQLTGRMPTD